MKYMYSGINANCIEMKLLNKINKRNNFNFINFKIIFKIPIN